MIDRVPAWSQQFSPGALEEMTPTDPIDNITREWAWGGSTGKGVRVAVIDSGIEASHPAVGRGVQGYVSIEEGPGGWEFSTQPHEDTYGHGTACAGIIRALAPDCDLYSVRVLGPALTGRARVFAAGLEWAIEHGMRVCNLSLGTTSRDFYALLHELADMAAFRNMVLVTAANNMPVPSFPSTYASVISVASHDRQNAEVFYYNPHPPMEFGAPGIGVRVAWRGNVWITATGNSFAAPHITGVVTRILAKHPELAVFQVKSVLRALAANMGTPGP